MLVTTLKTQLLLILFLSWRPVFDSCWYATAALLYWTNTQFTQCCLFYFLHSSRVVFALSAKRCWLGVTKSICPVKNCVIRCWHRYLYGARCKWFAIWSSWCHCHPIISCFIKIQNGLTFLVPVYPGCPGKEVIKWVSFYSCSNCFGLVFAICKCGFLWNIGHMCLCVGVCACAVMYICIYSYKSDKEKLKVAVVW